MTSSLTVVVGLVNVFLLDCFEVYETRFDQGSLNSIISGKCRPEFSVACSKTDGSDGWMDRLMNMN